jgi:hypothetical protein
MVAQVFAEQRKQELFWERLQQRKLEDTLSIASKGVGSSIKGSEGGSKN